MKKIISVFLLFILVFSTIPVYADNALGIEANSAILVDMTTGNVLYEKNIDRKVYPSSTALMLTAYICIQNCDMGQYFVVSEADLQGVSGDGIGLVPGESIGVGVILSAMLMANANDLAYLVANNVAGDSESFTGMMNDLADEIGCSSTHFTNPAGIDDPEQYTTSEDLAKIASYCMQDELFRKIASKSTMTVAATDYSGPRELKSDKLLLYDESEENMVMVYDELRACKYDGCIGVQSGLSEGAGACLISAAQRNDTTLLAVVMDSGASSRYSDSIKLLDYGFSHYKTVQFPESFINAGSISVKKGTVKSVPVKVSGVSYLTIPASENVLELSKTINLDDYITAPAAAGTKVGVMRIMSNLELVGECDIVTAEDLEEGSFWDKIKNKEIVPINFSDIWGEGSFLDKIGITDNRVMIMIIIVIAAGIVILLAIIISVYVFFERRRTRRLKAERAKKRAEHAERDKDLIEAWEKSLNANEEKK